MDNLRSVGHFGWCNFISLTSAPIARCETSHTWTRTDTSGDFTGTAPNDRRRRNTDKEKDAKAAEFLVELSLTIGLALVSSLLLSFLTKRLMKGVLPDSGDSETPAKQVYSRLQRILAKRGSTGRMPSLSPRELQMADEILDPDDIESSFADVGGLDATKQEIYELAVLPLVQPDLFSDSKLVQPVKGILLYGLPGTGKTMLAKALAKESGAIFIPLQLSKILNKFWGESNKLIAATFSLANKLQPAVIFIDELDTFLKNSNSETAYMDSIKAEFLTLWDGVATSSKSRVLVLGATNKPQHIDSAILRRMPRAFEVPLPNVEGRLAILELLLKEENVESQARSSLTKLATATKGYSGSDLKEVCRAAAMVAVQERTSEFARKRVMGEIPKDVDTKQKMRPISEKDLQVGLSKVKRTGESAFRYGKEAQKVRQQQQSDGSTVDLRNLAAMLRSLSALSADKNHRDNDEIPNLN